MIDPETLTGEMVREIREAHKLSRRAFAERCEFDSASRVITIETKNNFRGHDRERVARVLNELGDPPITGEQRAAQLDEKLRANGHSIHTDEPQTDQLFDSVAAEDAELLDRLAKPPDDSTETIYLSDLSMADLDDDYLATEIRPTDELPLIHPSQQEPADEWFRSWDRPGPRLKVITNSELTTWNRCRRKWWLQWYRALALGAVDYLNARSTGNRIHRALAAWYVPEGQPRTDPRDAYERIITEDWTAIREESGDLTDEALAELSNKFTEVCTLERIIVEGYMQWIEETGIDSEFEVIAPETALQADLEVDVDGVKYPVKVIGKLDARVRRIIDNVRMFIDHKSAQDFARPRKTLHMNPQMLHYRLLEFLNSEGADERCDTALYNMLRKVKRTASAKPPFYERVEIHHSDIEIDSYRRSMLGETRDIIRTEQALANGGDPLEIVYPNKTMDCSWDCDFFKVCPLFDDGSFAEEMIATQYRKVDTLARYEGTGVLE